MDSNRQNYCFRPVSSILAEEISLQQEIAPVKSGGIIVPRDPAAKDHASAFHNLPSPPTGDRLEKCVRMGIVDDEHADLHSNR